MSGGQLIPSFQGKAEYGTTMRMYSAYSDPQKDQTVKILVKYIQIDITIFFYLSQTWTMENIRGNRPNMEKISM